MPDIRELWWAAGRLAYDVSSTDWMNGRWHASLRRSASLLEPGWPTECSGGPFTYALPTVALLLYTRPTDDEPRDFPVERIVEELTTRVPALEDVIRRGLTDRRHDLDDDSQLSTWVRWLTEYREPLAYSGGGLELPSMESWPGGTLMGASARWAADSLTHHHLGAASAGG
ncbi:hypothetical protein AB0G42_16170 [Streptomyces yangpuensis]|uniref:hypothetical protein n=1 Tax=Streptomyces yangpuensis TaxID=1648182 RepID=UPI00343BE3C1